MTMTSVDAGPKTATEWIDHYRATRARMAKPQFSPQDETPAVMLSVWLYTIAAISRRHAWASSVRAEYLKQGIKDKLVLIARTEEERSIAASRPIRARQIQLIVAADYSVTLNDLLSKRRSQVLVKPRQIAMWFCKEMTLMSYPEIGRRFLRDHTTVLHGVRKIQSRVDREPAFAGRLSALRQRIELRRGA